jgi:ABC-type sugar transport system substrate-binding protein
VTNEIVNYINKGVVFGVLDRNGYVAGYESVIVLKNSFDHIFQENYVDIDIDIYTAVNIMNYEKSEK